LLKKCKNIGQAGMKGKVDKQGGDQGFQEKKRKRKKKQKKAIEKKKKRCFFFCGVEKKMVPRVLVEKRKKKGAKGTTHPRSNSILPTGSTRVGEYVVNVGVCVQFILKQK